MSSSPSPVIDGFTVGDRIGSGGSATVYRATQHGLKRDVAIKVLNAGFANDAERAQFQRECEVMGALSQRDGIVTVFQAIVTNTGLPAIVMELYDGTLRDRGILPVDTVVDVGIRAAEALAIIHHEKIIHRDIKPHNIFVAVGGQSIAIGDFGISSVQTERTMTGGAGFTIDYSPPEVFKEGGTQSPGDLYSLAATLYHLTTGSPPFRSRGSGDRIRDIAAQILQSPVPQLDQRFPASLNRLYQQGMAKQQWERPESAAAMAEELRRIQQEVGRPKAPIPPLASGADQPGTMQRQAGGTLVRTPHVPASQPPTPSADPIPAKPTGRWRQPWQRWPILGAGLGAIGLLAGIGFIGSQLLATEPTDPTVEAAEQIDQPVGSATNSTFLILSPPEGLRVSAMSATEFELTWDVTDPDLWYHVNLLGTAGEGGSTLTDQQPFVWSLDEVPVGDVCFEVRSAVPNQRMSASAAGPVCARHS